MNVLGNLKVLLEYILRNKQAQAKIVLSDEGNTPTDQTFKLPAADGSVSETDVLVAEQKTQTLKNKSINADFKPVEQGGDGNAIVNIYDASIHENADIQGSKLLDLSVGDAKIVGLDGSKLNDGTVSDVKLASGINGSKISDSTITTSKIADSNITTGKIADLAVTNDKVADGIDGGKLVDTSEVKIKELEVTGKITTGDIEVTNFELSGDITLPDGSINGSKLVDGSVTDDKLATGIDGSKLTDATVSGSALVDSAISTDKIADEAVTNSKLASGIDGSKLNDSSVSGSKLADGSITSEKLDAAFVIDGIVADGSIEDRHIKSIDDGGGIKSDKLIGYDPDYAISYQAVTSTSNRVSVNKIPNGLRVVGNYDYSDADSFKLQDDNNDSWELIGVSIQKNNDSLRLDGYLSQLDASIGETSESFGASVARNSKYIAVGYPYQNDGNSQNCGKVAIYDADTRELLDVIGPQFGQYPSGAVTKGFGYSLSMNEEFLVVGFPVQYNEGAVHVYSINEKTNDYPVNNVGTISQPQDITASNISFGESLDLNDNNTLTVGAPEATRSYAFVYDIDPMKDFFNEILIESYTGFEDNDDYGRSVAISNNYWAVGIPKYSSDPNFDTLIACGSVDIQQRDSDSGRWNYVNTIWSPNPLQVGFFGSSLDVSDEYVVVTEPNTSSKKIHIYALGDYSITYLRSIDVPTLNQSSGWGEGDCIKILGNKIYMASRKKRTTTNNDPIGEINIYDIETGSLLDTIIITNLGSIRDTNLFQIYPALAATTDGVLIGLTRSGSILNNGSTGSATSYSFGAMELINPQVTKKNGQGADVSNYVDIVDVTPSELNLEKGKGQGFDGAKIEVGSIPMDRLSDYPNLSLETLNVSADSAFKGSVKLEDDVSVGGDLDVSKGLEVGKRADVRGDLWVYGDINFQGDLYKGFQQFYEEYAVTKTQAEVMFQTRNLTNPVKFTWVRIGSTVTFSVDREIKHPLNSNGLGYEVIFQGATPYRFTPQNTQSMVYTATGSGIWTIIFATNGDIILTNRDYSSNNVTNSTTKQMPSVSYNITYEIDEE